MERRTCVDCHINDVHPQQSLISLIWLLIKSPRHLLNQCLCDDDIQQRNISIQGNITQVQLVKCVACFLCNMTLPQVLDLQCEPLPSQLVLLCSLWKQRSPKVERRHQAQIAHSYISVRFKSMHKHRRAKYTCMSIKPKILLMHVYFLYLYTAVLQNS